MDAVAIDDRNHPVCRHTRRRKHVGEIRAVEAQTDRQFESAVPRDRYDDGNRPFAA